MVSRSLIVALVCASSMAVGNPTPDRGDRADEPKLVGGFRMEGSARVNDVFGDTTRMRRQVDQFLEINEEMNETRRRFNRHVRGAITLLAKTKRGCPAEEVAPYYYHARDAANNYRRLGVRLERLHKAVGDLDRLGESKGLTPDYRWKVKRLPPLYSNTVTDYRDMRVAIESQLDRDLRHRGCKLSVLLTLGASAAAPETLPFESPLPEPARRHARKELATVAPANTVTYFIDNRHCNEAVTVFTDGEREGTVRGRSRGAFQTLAGTRVVCLQRGSDSQQCGEAGTVRSAYVHDGWSLTLHCLDDDAKGAMRTTQSASPASDAGPP